MKHCRLLRRALLTTLLALVFASSVVAAPVERQLELADPGSQFGSASVWYPYISGGLDADGNPTLLAIAVGFSPTVGFLISGHLGRVKDGKFVSCHEYPDDLNDIVTRRILPRADGSLLTLEHDSSWANPWQIVVLDESCGEVGRSIPDASTAAALDAANPAAVILGNDETLWIPRQDNDEIVHAAIDGTYLGAIGGSGLSDGEFQNIFSIAQYPNDDLLVLDSERRDLQRVTPDGDFVWRTDLGPSIQTVGRSFAGVSMAITSDGVAHGIESGQVHRFAADGTPLGPMSFGVAPSPQAGFATLIAATRDHSNLIIGQVNPLTTGFVGYSGSLFEYSAAGQRLRTLYDGASNVVAVQGMKADQSGEAIRLITTAYDLINNREYFGWARLIPGSTEYTVDELVGYRPGGTAGIGRPGPDGSYWLSGEWSGRSEALIRYSSAGTELAHVDESAFSGSDPHSISSDDDGGVWAITKTWIVGDTYDYNMYHFDPTGALDVTIPMGTDGSKSYDILAIGDGVVLRQDEGVAAATILRYSRSGDLTWSRSLTAGIPPGGITVDPQGRLAVTTAVEYKVYIYAPATGEHLETWSLERPSALDRYGLLFSVTFDAAGNLLGADVINGAVLRWITATEVVTTPTTPTTPAPQPPIEVTVPVRMVGPTVGAGGLVARPNAMVFTLEGARGDVSWRGWWGRKPIVVRNGRIIGPLPEGRKRLTIVGSDGSRSATWTRVLIIDRTPPTVVGSLDRVVLGGSSVRLDVTDGVSGPQRRTVRIAAPRHGLSTITRVRLTDKARNSTVVRVRVRRVLSLTGGWRNRGAVVRDRLGRPFDAGMVPARSMFRFTGPIAPWFAPNSRSRPFVLELQQRLARLGYWRTTVPFTGMLDLPTIRAVQRFQRANSLRASGVPNRATRRLLDRLQVQAAR